MFLSGGIDSSLIASTLQNSSSKINTFTIGFKNDKYDESKYAKKVANFLGTNHNEFILEPQEALNIIYELLKFIVNLSLMHHKFLLH